MFTVSIVIPTYHRKKFEKLIEYNILCQTYKNIIEVVIGDDGEDNLKLNVPYPITYLTMDRCTIGQKRNLLCKYAKGDIIVHMDTDDFYFPSYIEHSISKMIMMGKNCAGTADMFMFYKNEMRMCKMENYVLHMANEGTLVYTKKFWEECPFSENQTSEGLAFLKNRDNQIVKTDIRLVMICVCHSENTVDKSCWKNLICNDFPNFHAHLQIAENYVFP